MSCGGFPWWIGSRLHVQAIDKCLSRGPRFSGIMTNMIFLGVIFATIIIQVLTVQFGKAVFQTVPLDIYDWIVCILIAA